MWEGGHFDEMWAVHAQHVLADYPLFNTMITGLQTAFGKSDVFYY